MTLDLPSLEEEVKELPLFLEEVKTSWGFLKFLRLPHFVLAEMKSRNSLEIRKLS